MRKSGRHKTEDTLYLTVRDFLVYLKSLRVGVEVLPLPDDHPGRKHRPRIPWGKSLVLPVRSPDPDLPQRYLPGGTTSSDRHMSFVVLGQVSSNQIDIF